MKLFWSIFEVSVSLFENYVMLDFISKLFGTKFDKIKCKIGFFTTLLIMFLESAVINKFATFEAFSVFIPIFTLFLYAYVFLSGNMLEKLFISFLTMTTIILINSVTALLISVITGTTFLGLVCNQNFYRFVAVIVTKAIFFLVTRLLLRFYSFVRYSSLNKKEICMILFSPVLSIFFSAQMVSVCMDTKIIDKNIYFTLIFLFLCVLSANFTSYYLFVKINKSNLSKLKLFFLKQQYDYQIKNIEQMKNTYDEMRKIRHDMKNNIFCIMALIEQKKYDSAMEYTSALSKKIENTKLFAYTNNEAFNSIINLKLSMAQEKNIKLHCDITDRIIDIDDIDLCILISNLLDNAIEANQKINDDNRYVEVIIKNIEENMIFIIKNKIIESVLTKNPELLTDKKNNKLHGIGNASVKSVVEKYNGSIIYYEKDGLFCCEAVLKNLITSKEAV